MAMKQQTPHPDLIVSLVRSFVKSSLSAGVGKTLILLYAGQGKTLPLSEFLRRVFTSAVRFGFFILQHRVLQQFLTAQLGASNPLTVVIPGGVSGVILSFAAPGVAQELLLYTFKFVLEGLINSTPQRVWSGFGVKVESLIQLSAFAIFAALFYLYEYDKKTLKSYCTSILDFFYKV
eukprot:TRINITY_DN122_c0_g4_i1.p1 TRINITY_DN122_c0_g4~~TRINITY_DN122_c0_g4_i1.p1  ORF type:complete len:177 (+),score=40.39 TRINITY_DN122_c0_g4_i1:52-582(+)